MDLVTWIFTKPSRAVSVELRVQWAWKSEFRCENGQFELMAVSAGYYFKRVGGKERRHLRQQQGERWDREGGNLGWKSFKDI